MEDGVALRCERGIVQVPMLQLDELVMSQLHAPTVVELLPHGTKNELEVM